MGPHDSGKSLGLTAWAFGRDDVDRVENGTIPDRESGFLVIDDAEQADDATWRELDRRLAAYPELAIRAAALTAESLPQHWEVEIRRDLYLTAEEIAQLLEELGSPADPTLVESITRGHAGTTRYLARSGLTRRPDMLRALTRAPSPDGVPEVAGEIAVPQYLTTGFLEKLGRDPRELDVVEQAGAGGWYGPPSTQVFVLHPAVRAKVRDAETFDQDRRNEIRALAADSLVDAGAFLEGIAESVAAQRLDITDRAITEGSLTLVTSHPVQVEALLRGVPLQRLAEHPVVAATLGLVMRDDESSRPRVLDVVRVADTALAAVSARGAGHGATGMRIVLKALEAMSLRVTVAEDEGIEAARRAVDMIDGLSLEERDEMGTLRGIVLTNLALTLLYGGHLGEARLLAARGMEVPQKSAESLFAAGMLAIIDVLAGRMATARRTVARAERNAWSESLMESNAGEPFRIAQAWVAVERSDLDAAGPLLESLMERAEGSEHWHLMAHVRALFDIESGDVEAGIQRFHALRTLRSDKKSNRRRSAFLLRLTESMLYLANGEHAKAAAAVREPTGDVWTSLAAARVAVARGQDREAFELVSAGSRLDPRDQMTAYVLRAVLLKRAGREKEAARTAERAVAIASVHELTTPLKYLLPADQELFGPLAESLPALVVEGEPVPTLTPRERVIADALRRRGSLGEIAEGLHVSTNTVKSQVRSLYRKLGAASREEAVLLLLALGLLDD
ncbi:regulatory protein, LuxR [Actinomycetales bacterium JB111]|nr:regulatory protein, LuxR [Actinomycetales bacterium JB111]